MNLQNVLICKFIENELHVWQSEASVVTKCDSPNVLQKRASVITKLGTYFVYKEGQVILQSRAGITKYSLLGDKKFFPENSREAKLLLKF